MTSQQSGLDSIYTQPLEREITEGDTARKHPAAGDMTEE